MELVDWNIRTAKVCLRPSSFVRELCKFYNDNPAIPYCASEMVLLNRCRFQKHGWSSNGGDLKSDKSRSETQLRSRLMNTAFARIPSTFALSKPSTVSFWSGHSQAGNKASTRSTQLTSLNFSECAVSFRASEFEITILAR